MSTYYCASETLSEQSGDNKTTLSGSFVLDPESLRLPLLLYIGGRISLIEGYPISGSATVSE